MLKISGQTQEEIDKNLEEISFVDMTFLLRYFVCDIGDIVKAVCKYKGVKYERSGHKPSGVSCGKT